MKFYIVTTDPKSEKEREMYNKVYQCFKDVWHDIFKDKFNVDSLKRQKYICALEAEGKVVAILSCDTFDLRCDFHRENSYFKDYPEDFIPYAEEMNHQRIMSFESLTVSKGLRGNIAGLRISELILQLTFAFSDFVDVDACYAPVVRANKASAACVNFGAEVVVPEIDYRGLFCDLLVLHRGQRVPLKEGQLKDQFDKLWAERVDFSAVTTQDKTAIVAQRSVA